MRRGQTLLGLAFFLCALAGEQIAHADFQASEEPAFSVNDKAWHLLTIANQEAENLRMYGYKDSEASLVSDPEQLLQVHITYNPVDVDKIHDAISSVFPSATTETLVNEREVTIYSTEIRGSDKVNVLPKMIFITAAYTPFRDNKIVIVQYVLQPKCSKCMHFEDEWIERLKLATIDEANKTILFDDGDITIPLHQFVGTQGFQVTETAKGWLPWVSDAVSGAMARLMAIGGTMGMVAVKLVQGFYGTQGPCGQSGFACQCGLPPGIRAR
jgi:hypothetical protein